MSLPASKPRQFGSRHTGSFRGYQAWSPNSSASALRRPSRASGAVASSFDLVGQFPVNYRLCHLTSKPQCVARSANFGVDAADLFSPSGDADDTASTFRRRARVCTRQGVHKLFRSHQPHCKFSTGSLLARRLMPLKHHDPISRPAHRLIDDAQARLVLARDQ
jgi:hypothetical protein